MSLRYDHHTCARGLLHGGHAVAHSSPLSIPFPLPLCQQGTVGRQEGGEGAGRCPSGFLSLWSLHRHLLERSTWPQGSRERPLALFPSSPSGLWVPAPVCMLITSPRVSATQQPPRPSWLLTPGCLFFEITVRSLPPDSTPSDTSSNTPVSFKYGSVSLICALEPACHHRLAHVTG